MTDFSARRRTVAGVASNWRDPDYSPRESALEATLEAPNRWTEKALNYALNRWMQRLTEEALDQWIGPLAPARNGSIRVGVLHGNVEPLSGLRDALAVLMYGHAYLGHASESSPTLLPAFVDEVVDHLSDVEATFGTREEVLGSASAVMAQPEREEVEAIHEECRDYDIPEVSRLIRPPLLAVGVLDGHESKGVRDRFAEDLLLYEGGGHRRLALLWAPRNLSPDPYLEAMARFRGAFPVHPDTPGALQMQKAFLEARDKPHAYAEGLQFLVSRGDPEPQPQGHVRWSEYDDFDDIEDWMQDYRESIYHVVARKPLHDQLPSNWSPRTPGGLHVPPLDDEEGEAIADFVHSLG